MGRRSRIPSHLFVALAFPCLAAWWGCAKGSGESGSNISLGTGGAGGAGSSSSGGDGGFVANGGAGGGDGGGHCTSTSAKAHPFPLDLIVLLDRSGSMTGEKWEGTTAALTSFFNDPASAGIGAGLIYFPTEIAWDCDVTHYEVLDVAIDELPGNAFALTNSMPADATGVGTPMYGALKGALMVATAYQDLHPDHKVNLLLATDGDGNGCSGATMTATAALAKSALDYNGVHTYAIGVAGATIPNLDQIAHAGGTTAAYDVTFDINEFAAKMSEIRAAALGCDFTIPPPPHGSEIDPSKVNVDYTPNGTGQPTVLPRAHDAADCADEPGWYFDNNTMPTRVILCPASCSTVQHDANAEVSVLFGCASVLK